VTGQLRDGPADAAMIEAPAAGIRASIRQATLAEGRLAAFASRADGPAPGRPAGPGPRHFVGRVLGAAADPATVRPPEAVRGGAAPMGELPDRADLGAEPR